MADELGFQFGPRLSCRFLSSVCPQSVDPEQQTPIMTSRKVVDLLDLPPELLSHILQFCTLSSAISFSQTSSQLRSHLFSSHQWIEPLLRTAILSNHHILYPSQSTTTPTAADENLILLGTVAGLTNLNSTVWIEFLPFLSRLGLRFIELPRLSNQDWYTICQSRFSKNVVSKFELALDEERTLAGSVTKTKMPGRWREFFWNTIDKYEHTSTTGCNTEHNCHYVILHRLAGLANNRSSFREFDGLRIFRDLKRENDLTHHKTLQLTLPDELVPSDLRVHVYVTIAPGIRTYLKNELATQVLTRLGCWKASHRIEASILGPVLITATIRPSPRSNDRVVDSINASFDRVDFLAIVEKIGLDQTWWQSKCANREGFGFA